VTKQRLESLRLGLRLTMAAIYIVFGVLHLRRADAFLPIMPPAIPYPRLMILFTGACEILGGVGLLTPRVRRLAGVMLAIYAFCVWPANIYHAIAHVHVPSLPDSWWYHAPRLAFQPVFIWWALFAGGATDWPFRKKGAVLRS
jgi:uncharacterized membrane protein